MCLRPLKILNPAYQVSLKNPLNDRKPLDPLLKYIEVPCGHCYECRRKKTMDWRIRCIEHNKYMQSIGYYGYFVTLTFSDRSLSDLSYSCHSNDALVIATYALRKFRDRWRKSNIGDLHYFLIPELGHNATERLHFHGFIWQQKSNPEPYQDRYCIPFKTKSTITNIWRYGNIYFGHSVSNKAISYITKYMLKQDLDHTGFCPSPYVSRFFGKSFIDHHNYSLNNPVTTYRLDNGKLTSLPRYYMHHFYDTYVREQLQLQMLKNDYQYIHGVKVFKPTTDDIKSLTATAKQKYDKYDYNHDYITYPASKSLSHLLHDHNYKAIYYRLTQPLYSKRSSLIVTRGSLQYKSPLYYYYTQYINAISDLLLYIKIHRDDMANVITFVTRKKQILSDYFNNKFNLYYYGKKH